MSVSLYLLPSRYVDSTVFPAFRLGPVREGVFAGTKSSLVQTETRSGLSDISICAPLLAVCVSRQHGKVRNAITYPAPLDPERSLPNSHHQLNEQREKLAQRRV